MPPALLLQTFNTTYLYIYANSFYIYEVNYDKVGLWDVQQEPVVYMPLQGNLWLVVIAQQIHYICRHRNNAIAISMIPRKKNY